MVHIIINSDTVLGAPSSYYKSMRASSRRRARCAALRSTAHPASGWLAVRCLESFNYCGASICMFDTSYKVQSIAHASLRSGALLGTTRNSRIRLHVSRKCTPSRSRLHRYALGLTRMYWRLNVFFFYVAPLLFAL